MGVRVRGLANTVTGLLDGTTIGSVGDHITRNDFGEVVEYTASVGMPLVMSVAYVRDQVGRIKQKTEMLDGDLGSTDTFYKYDQAGRLHQVCDDDECTSIRAQYDYDLNSNRTGGFTASGAIEADYDEQDRLLSYSTTSGSVTTTTTYTYTANGELETKPPAATSPGGNLDIHANAALSGGCPRSGEGRGGAERVAGAARLVVGGRLAGL